MFCEDINLGIPIHDRLAAISDCGLYLDAEMRPPQMTLITSLWRDRLETNIFLYQRAIHIGKYRITLVWGQQRHAWENKYI